MGGCVRDTKSIALLESMEINGIIIYIQQNLNDKNENDDLLEPLM